MMQPLSEEPQGIQAAPHDVRMVAAGYQVSLREVNLSGVRDKEGLMMAFLSGLALTQSFGRNWDALYDVLTDPGQCPARFALLLTDYPHFKGKYSRLATELEGVLLEAQANAAEQGRKLWLLAGTTEN